MKKCLVCDYFEEGICTNNMYVNNRYRGMPEKLNANDDCFYFVSKPTLEAVKKELKIESAKNKSKNQIKIKDAKKEKIKTKGIPKKVIDELNEPVKVEIQSSTKENLVLNNIILKDEIKTTGSTEGNEWN